MVRIVEIEVRQDIKVFESLINEYPYSVVDDYEILRTLTFDFTTAPNLIWDAIELQDLIDTFIAIRAEISKTFSPETQTLQLISHVISYLTNNTS